jgi:hypothetical protein
MSEAGTANESQRPLALALIVVAGLVSLPVAAAVLDGESTDQLIVPVQLAAMAVLGAVVGYALPGLGGAGSSRPRSAALGTVVGVAAALVSLVVFALLLGDL